MGTMHVLGKKGDSTMKWDPADATATATARQTFNALRAQGMLAFVPSPSGGEQIEVFRPDAEEIMWVRPIAGGR